MVRSQSPIMKTNIKYYEAAGITVQVISDFPIYENTFHPKFKLFEVDKQTGPNIIVKHHFALPKYINELTLKKNQLYNKDHWIIYKTDTCWIYKYTPLLKSDPGYKAIGIFNNDHSFVEIFTDIISKTQYQTASLNALTLFNTDQILFSKPICDRNGLILHSNGFNIDGNGVLFVGESGAGKSTLSSMLQQKGLEVLCDDRMFITQINNNFWIHGNWCHGTVANVANISTPLKKIFFIKQSQINKATKITSDNKKIQPLLQSLVKAFLTSSDWEITLFSLNKLLRSTDCYFLEFNLSGEIFKTITNELTQ